MSTSAGNDNPALQEVMHGGHLANIFDGKARAAEVMASAVEYSMHGLSLIVVLGANASLEDFRVELTRTMTELVNAGIPVQLFGLRSAQSRTYGYFIIDGHAYGRAPYNMTDYDLADAGLLRSDAAGVFRMTGAERLALLEARRRERESAIRAIDAEIAELQRKLAENAKAQDAAR